MTGIERAIAEWRTRGYELNPSASQERLGVLAQSLGVALPEDVAVYFSTVDGMVDHATDQWLVSFWSIERILSDPYVQSGGGGADAYRDVAFADVMISSWFYFYRVRSSGRVTIFVEATGEEIASLDAFFLRYLERPGSVGL